MYIKSSTAPRAELLVSGLYNFRSAHSTNSSARLAQGSIGFRSAVHTTEHETTLCYIGIGVPDLA